MMISLIWYLIVLKDKFVILIIVLKFSWQPGNHVEVMHLSIVCPTTTHGAMGRERCRFYKTEHQMPHHLGRSGDQFSFYPLYLGGNLIKQKIKFPNSQIPTHCHRLRGDIVRKTIDRCIYCIIKQQSWRYNMYTTGSIEAFEVGYCT